MKAIEGIEDIRFFVDEFYGKVREDELLAPVFLGAITDWGHHMETMYAFWNAALFGVPGFRGNPAAKHAALDVETAHFRRWLDLFFTIIDEHFEGYVAADAKNRAELMAFMFLARIQKAAGNTGKIVY